MKIVFIVNPTSGNKNLRNLKEELNKNFSNFYFEIWETEKPLQAIELGKKAVDLGYDTVIAVGGDGTVIEVISGIINSNVKLGIIPFGTGNMLASNLNIPVNISQAIKIISEGYSQKIDIGKINDNKYFAFMAGCGFAAKIIRRVSREKKKKFGLLAYFVEGVIQSLKTRPHYYQIKLDDNKTIDIKALTILIANGGNFIKDLFCIAPQASVFDGLLDIIVISTDGVKDYIPILWKIFTRKICNERKKIQYYQAKKIEIISKPPSVVQADGDIIGKTPIKIEIIPSAIDILIPKNQY